MKAAPETILAHLAMARGNRPILAGKSPEELDAFVRKQLAEREVFYTKARHIINVDILDSFEKINDVVEMIAAHLDTKTA